MSVVGMKCEACGGASFVGESRKSRVDNAIRRRRKCRACKRVWATVEISADVVKYLFKENKKLLAMNQET